MEVLMKEEQKEQQKMEENVNEEINEKKQTNKKQKKKASWLFCVIIFILLCGSLGRYIDYKYYEVEKIEDIPIKKIEISVMEQQIEVNNSIEIKTTIEPSNYNLSNMEWMSSNPECIVIENGVAKAIGVGESTIYVINDNGIKSNEILVKAIIGVKEIILSKDNLEITIGNSEKLTATILPENATNKNLFWKTSDENIAKNDGNGTITGVNVGQCIAYASTEDEKVVAQCVINIKPVEVKSVSLDDTNVTLAKGQEYILLATVLPQNATYKNVTWTSSNEAILTVNEGRIKAISEGEAIVTIKTTNNKQASCKFVVKNNLSAGTIKYSKNTYNIRSGPNTNYTKIGSVSKNEEVEILRVYKNWTKIRTSSGLVGYMITDGYTSSKAYNISNVPFLNQFSLGYPTGCEAVSATMAAKYSGYNVSAEQIIAATPTDEKGKRQETKIIEIQEEQMNQETGEVEIITKTQEQTDWYGGNPFEVFVGHPSKKRSTGSYGCFAKPIVIALKKCGIPATNISGSSIETVFNYIEKGKPVVVWCKKNAGDLTEGVTWKYEDGSGSYTELVGEHCAVLIGYDGEYVYLNDPSAGKNVKQPRAKFISNWQKLFSQAVVID